MPGRHVLIPAVLLAVFCLTLIYSTTEAPARSRRARTEPMMLMAVQERPAAVRKTDPLSITGIEGIAAAPAPLPAAIARPATEAAEPAGATPLPRETTPPEASSQPATYTATALVTGYCPCRRCCGRFANGRTSIGTSAWKPGIAADPDVLPYGTVVEVPGYGAYKVDDTGIAMRRSWRYRGRLHLDLRFTYHWQARQWGAQYVRVRITPPADE
ncbi:MAG: 3D domain-containing protein [Planctomycetota bacterium]